MKPSQDVNPHLGRCNLAASTAGSVCLPSCGGVRPNRASPCAEGVGVAVPRRSTIKRLRSGASGSRHHPSAQRPLGLRGRSPPRWHVCALRFSAPLHSATADSPLSAMRHPSANAACMAWSEYLPSPCKAASRRLSHRGGESALAPWLRYLAPCALKAPAPSRGARGAPYAAFGGRLSR